MKISIVSPSFNQAAFIDATIASVAAQTYADKEHIICDGGSTDGSVEKVQAAAAANAHIRTVIQADRGQADAINKGFRLASGDILAWINTDDKYADVDVFAAVIAEFEQHPDADLIYARGRRIRPDGAFIREAWINRAIDGPEALRTRMGVFQPSVFFRRSVFEKVGGLSETYNLQLDYEYWVRMLQAGVRFHFMDRVLADAIVHKDAKSTRHRLSQLSECISMIEDRYGETPDEWIERFARFDATRRDEKVAHDDRASADEQAAAQATKSAVKAMLGKAQPPLAPRIILTSFDSKYFQQGLNLIASLHRTSFASFDEIIVYALGLSVSERETLGSLAKVRVVDYPDAAPVGFPDFYEPLGRAYKVAAIAGAGLGIPTGALVLWMDAGLSCCTDIEEIFEKIAAEDFFITDHDDSAFWPFFNVHFLHRGAVNAINPSKAELLAPHLCSCLVGYKVQGRFQALIDDALRIGMKREAVVWPKVLKAGEKPRNAIAPEENRGYRDTLLADAAALDALTVDDLYARFPYYGHRTQSIFSVLAARYGARASSATLFHKSNAISSRAAAANWAEGADKTHEFASREVFDGVTSETRIYHHRGVFTDLSGLVFDRASEPALIVGNGPSLRGFDFETLRDKVWVGMNAAYRFWDEHKLYPHIYVCFDTTVQDSHRDEIKRLIERRQEYGIRWFFLRKSFLEFWPEAIGLGCVFFLEDLQKSVEWFDRGKITTGSFSLYVLSFLGFSEIYILGVDLNYVEQIAEAEQSGRELVIKADVATNPNYFFDSYQRPGDRYNPPNRHPDMHLRSWQEAADVLASYPIAIYNGNPNSAVRAFPFISRDKAVRGLNSKQMRALRAAERVRAFAERRTAWRNRLLTHVGDAQIPSQPFSENQARRIGEWLRAESRGEKLSRVRATDSLGREAHAHLDETAIVSMLLADRRGRSHVMLDVGAHHGSSAQYFHRLDWSIYCFEPDPANRAKLEARFGATANIVIDARAVSDQPATDVPFFSSEESTGISGLHAFRDTHQESARVEVTTVTNIIAQHALERVDFLKIDVEGFDFAVLKGVPWGRLQPDVIECEFEDAKTTGMGHTWREIAAFLEGKGYAVYLSEWHPITRYGVRHDWRRLIPLGGAEVAADSWGNILAFKTDPGLTAVRNAFHAAVNARAGGAPKTKPKPKPRPASPRAAASRMHGAPAATNSVPRLRFYAPLANKLKDRAPQAFTVLRFGKQVAASLWRRRMASAPAALLLACWMIAGLFLPQQRAWIWGAGAFVFLLAAIGYVALRVRQFIEQTIAENTALRQQLADVSQRITSVVAHVSQVERQNSKTIAGVRSRMSQSDEHLAAIEKQYSEALYHLEAQLAQASQRATSIEASAEVAANSALAKIDQLLDRLVALRQTASESIAAAEQNSAKAVAALDKSTAASLAKLQEEGKARDKQAAEHIARIEHTSTFNNASWYQRFNRQLTQEQIDVLKVWAEATPAKPNAQMLGYAAHRACLMESRMAGRLATSLEDILLRTIMSMSGRRSDMRLEVLEIGTLFGIGAGIMYDAMAPHFANVHMTLLDPLDGYYSAKRLDILTGQPISENTLRRNLAEVGLSGEDFTLIKHLSTDAEAIETARKRRYDVIVIDGDHTYAGVKADFDLYSPMLSQDGIVIFDDYAALDWPEVKAFVDAEVAPLSEFEFVGHEWRTCVYRRKRQHRPNKVSYAGGAR